MLRDRKSIEYFRLFIVGGLYRGLSIRVQHSRSPKIIWRGQEKWEKHAAVDGNTNTTKWCLRKFKAADWVASMSLCAHSMPSLASRLTHLVVQHKTLIPNLKLGTTIIPALQWNFLLLGLLGWYARFRKKKSHHFEVSRPARDSGAHTQCGPFESWKGWPGVGGNLFVRFVGGCNRDQIEWEI
jgi:hypothetical protein